MSLLNDILEHAELAPAQLMSYIDDYESIQPYDCMISTARAVVSFFAQEYEASEKWILRALQKNPANHMNHFYYALIAKSLGQYLTAAVECWTAINFATQFGEPAGWTDFISQLNDVLTEIASKLSSEEAAQFFIRRNILRSPGSFSLHILSMSKTNGQYLLANFYIITLSRNITIMFPFGVSRIWMCFLIRFASSWRSLVVIMPTRLPLQKHGER